MYTCWSVTIMNKITISHNTTKKINYKKEYTSILNVLLKVSKKFNG